MNTAARFVIVRFPYHSTAMADAYFVAQLTPGLDEVEVLFGCPPNGDEGRQVAIGWIAAGSDAIAKEVEMRQHRRTATGQGQLVTAKPKAKARKRPKAQQDGPMPEPTEPGGETLGDELANAVADEIEGTGSTQ